MSTNYFSFPGLPVDMDFGVRAYVRGRLEYGRFLRQTQGLATASTLGELTHCSALDFYPNDRPFGDMEQGKIVILSCYDGMAEDEEAVVTRMVAFLEYVAQSPLFPKLVWIIGAEETELETLNLLLSYALLAGSIEAEEAEEPETPEASQVPDALDTPVTNLEDHIRISSLEELRSAWTEDLCPFDVFWPGLGELSVFAPDSAGLPEFSLAIDPSQSLAATLLQAWQEFRQSRQGEAQTHFHQEAWSQAVAGYGQVVRYGGWESLGWHNLGVALFKDQQLPLAFRANAIAIELDPTIPKYYNILGLIAEGLGHRDLAQALYQTCINQDPTYDQGYLNLGLLFEKESNPNLAAETYYQGLQHIQTSPALYNNLANLVYAQGNFELARHLYEKVLNCNYENCIQVLDLFNNLDAVASALGKSSLKELYVGMRANFVKNHVQDVIDFYTQNRGKEFADKWYYFDMYTCFENLSKYQELNELACEFLQRDKFFHQDKYFFNCAVHSLFINGYLDTAKELLSQSPSFKNLNSVVKRFIQSRLFQPIYDSTQSIKDIRAEIEDSLHELMHLDLSLKSNVRDLMTMFRFNNNSNFYLIYQQFNEVEFNSQYSYLVTRVLQKYLPDHLIRKPDQKFSVDRKIRLGYFSYNFVNLHSGTIWSLGWIQNHDREKFEIYCYSLNPDYDSTTAEFQQYSDYFRKIDTDWQGAIESILADNLHILIFPDIGMGYPSILLSNLRLAPIQCTAWGHPLTSGSSNIDYYLSGDAIEPKNAQEHYVETLVRLPKLGICYQKRDVPPLEKSKQDFNFPIDKVLYLSCQVACKYLPQYDFIYPEIALKNQNARFIFIKRSRALEDKLMERLGGEFEKYGLNAHDYCMLLPQQSLKDYLMIMMLVDVNLDTIGFSGGHTTFDAVTCGLPTVTYPGEFMRGRQSYGILKVMGITETIAETLEDYIDIAVRLGRDEGWRREISDLMKARQDLVFNDVEVVKHLDAFLEEAVQRKLKEQEQSD